MNKILKKINRYEFIGVLTTPNYLIKGNLLNDKQI
jgi:hypothetical protein